MLWTKQQGPPSDFARHALLRPREFDLDLRRCRLAQSLRTTPGASRRDRAAPLRLDSTRLLRKRVGLSLLGLSARPLSYLPASEPARLRRLLLPPTSAAPTLPSQDDQSCRKAAASSRARRAAAAARPRRLAARAARRPRSRRSVFVLVARLTASGDRRATAHVRAVAPGRALPARRARPRPVHHHRPRHVRPCARLKRSDAHRNVNKQATNIHYHVDDGTGSIDVRQWIDGGGDEDENDPNAIT